MHPQYLLVPLYQRKLKPLTNKPKCDGCLNLFEHDILIPAWVYAMVMEATCIL